VLAKPDGNTLRTQRTRARILEAGLRLFNERGEAHVTTGTIAESLGISPGNLYYHFRNKDQVVEELFARFEARIDVEPAASPDAAGAMEDLWLYLHLMLEGIWEYRFLYRNLDDLLERNRRLRERFNRILDRKHRAIVALCESLAQAGALRARPAEIRALAANVLVVATYWLNFQSLRSRGGSARGDRAGTVDLGHGAYQVMALVAPYLVGEARRHLDHLTRAYIDND
jgi:AcrR family transcriptional regulator